MHPAQHLLLHQRELLAGGQLPLAGEAGEAGQVVDVALRPAHPVCGVDVPAAARTPGAVSSAGGGHGEQIRHTHTLAAGTSKADPIFFSYDFFLVQKMKSCCVFYITYSCICDILR